MYSLCSDWRRSSTNPPANVSCPSGWRPKGFAGKPPLNADDFSLEKSKINLYDRVHGWSFKKASKLSLLRAWIIWLMDLTKKLPCLLKVICLHLVKIWPCPVWRHIGSQSTFHIVATKGRNLRESGEQLCRQLGTLVLRHSLTNYWVASRQQWLSHLEFKQMTFVRMLLG